MAPGDELPVGTAVMLPFLALEIMIWRMITFIVGEMMGSEPGFSLADSICANRLENEAAVNIRGLSDLAKYRYISDIFPYDCQRKAPKKADFIITIGVYLVKPEENSFTLDESIQENIKHTTNVAVNSELFFWQGDENKKKYRLAKWSILCQPKDQGGIGILDLNTMNRALLSKWLGFGVCRLARSVWNIVQMATGFNPPHNVEHIKVPIGLVGLEGIEPIVMIEYDYI
ncbi:hypothetical protein ACJX0J_018506 [Zea mays]